MTETTATWGSWKSHGNAAELYYWGQNRKAPDYSTADGRHLVVSMEKGMLIGRDKASGKAVLTGGNATRFWASPVEAGDSEYEEHYGTKPASDPEVIAKQAADDVVVKAAKVRSDCRCGCGTSAAVRRLYRQGHDAKHVMKLRIEVSNGRMSVKAAIDQMPTDALKNKLAYQLNNG